MVVPLTPLVPLPQVTAPSPPFQAGLLIRKLPSGRTVTPPIPTWSPALVPTSELMRAPVRAVEQVHRPESLADAAIQILGGDDHVAIAEDGVVTPNVSPSPGSGSGRLVLREYARRGVADDEVRRVELQRARGAGRGARVGRAAVGEGAARGGLDHPAGGHPPRRQAAEILLIPLRDDGDMPARPGRPRGVLAPGDHIDGARQEPHATAGRPRAPPAARS